MTAVEHYDVIVIGAGAGLPKLARPAAQLGLKVALIEKDRFGGTCLNRGCIPSKMLIHPADVAVEIDEAERMNIDQKGYTVDYTGIIKRVAEAIDADALPLPEMLGKKFPNLHQYRNEAHFVGPRKLQVAPDKVISADKVFIAAGARPRIPDIPGFREGPDKVPFLTSTEALRLEKKPEHLIVIGSGFISCELSHFFAAMGVHVTMLVRSIFIRGTDGEVREEFTKAWVARPNIDVVFCASPVSASHDGSQFTVEYDLTKDGIQTIQKISGDQLLVAAGVVPNSEALHLQAAGIETTQKGFIKVDKCLRTTCDNTWALGDIAGNYQFRHSANREGEYLMINAIRNAMTPDTKPINYKGMGYAVFSNPQIAGVGLTEEQCAGMDYVKGVNRYSGSAMGMALRSTVGFAKILVEVKSRRILGFHIVGREASTLIHQLSAMIRKDATLDDFLDMIYIHPALNEIVRNAGRKARDALMERGEDLPLELVYG